ncbi:MAG: YciI family protein [Solirubrobacteraceae bacterium]
MRYLLQIYMPEDGSVWERLSEDEKSALSGEYVALMQAPGVTGGAQLQPATSATTIRVQDGSPLSTDGPFLETKEALGGYYLLEVDDLDAAIELAARVPAARMGGAVEVRPLVEP